jgi:hypothetical protein
MEGSSRSSATTIPLSQPYELVVHKDKVETWISKGAQPSEQVASLLRSLTSRPRRSPWPVRAATAAAGDKPAKCDVKRAKPRVISPRKQRARRGAQGREEAGRQGRLSRWGAPRLRAARRPHSRPPMRLGTRIACCASALALARFGRGLRGARPGA